MILYRNMRPRFAVRIIFFMLKYARLSYSATDNTQEEVRSDLYWSIYNISGCKSQ